MNPGVGHFETIVRKGTKMKLFTLLVVLHFGVLAKAVQCRDLFPYKLEISQTTRSNVFEYSQPKERSLDSYFDYLTGFKKALENLKSDGQHLDGGSGFGIASLQIVEKFPGIVSIAVNRTHFWKDLLQRMAAEESYVSTWKNKYPSEVEVILSKISSQTGWTWKTSKDVSAALEKAKKQGFKYVDGDVQSVLMGMIQRGEKINLYSDVWGAYAYSANRVELLELIYEVLQHGGQAFILTQDQVADRAENADQYHRVMNPSGHRAPPITLEKYLLLKKDPAISFVGPWPQTLVLTKIPGREHLNLGLKMVPGTVQYTGGAQFPFGVQYQRDYTEFND